MMTLEKLDQLHSQYKIRSLDGRYINLDMISPIYDEMDQAIAIELIGESVNGNPIHALKWGSGKTRVLMWSQMHGNESTTTKAVFDLFNALKDPSLNHLSSEIQLCCIPMLNPDGAMAYTRLNANQVDLNRDAQDLTQPESRLLRKLFDTFKPQYCFNLHGQRTLYSAGPNPRSAVLSFLSPAADPGRSINDTRKKAMAVVSGIFESLTPIIPGQIALYNDTFNPNCVGDTFQALNVPTVLFEAGHYPSDYKREITRALIFKALAVSFDFIVKNPGSVYGYEKYTNIPKNEERFFDILIHDSKDGKDIGIRYKETLKNKNIEFVPEIASVDNLHGYYGHREFSARGHAILDVNKNAISVGDEIDIVLINDELFSLKLIES